MIIICKNNEHENHRKLKLKTLDRLDGLELEGDSGGNYAILDSFLSGGMLKDC